MPQRAAPQRPHAHDVLVRLEAVARDGLAQPSPGTRSTPQGELRWGADGIALGELAIAPDELIAIQLARSVERVLPTGLAGLLGRPPRRIARAHLEVRARSGVRLRLTAVANETAVAGLPELRCEGTEVALTTLLAVAETALALGARLARVEPEALGASAIAPVESHPGEVYEDRVAVADADGKWGYRNGAGELVIDHRFDEAMPFSDAHAAVRVGGRWGYVDGYGDWLVEPSLRRAGPVFRAKALVETAQGEAVLSVRSRRITQHPRALERIREEAWVFSVLAFVCAFSGSLFAARSEEGTAGGSMFLTVLATFGLAAVGLERWYEQRGLRAGRRRRSGSQRQSDAMTHLERR